MREIKRTCEDVLEGELYVAGVQGGGLDEGQVVLACADEVLASSRIRS